ncbi:MAG: signal peptidase I, partial [Patescibacteria group bacterium]
EIKDAKVYINGVVLDESYAHGSMSQNLKIVLAENQYFILGDNRSNSIDSRILGPISKDNILGKLKSL